MAAEITTNAASAQLSVPVTNGAASAAALRRVSAPHIPLMVVVTDVDGEKSDGIVATTTTAGALSLPACADDDAHSNHHHNHTSIYSKLAKGIVRNEDKADAGEHFSMTPLPSASGGGGTALTQDDKNGKPITKWRRICKCFIGLKITKKHKNSAGHLQQNQSVSTSSAADKKMSVSSTNPVSIRDRSQSLHPDLLDPDMSGRLSVSPARSSQSIRSRLSSRSETDFYLFDMGSMSEILTITDIKMLGKYFPPQAVGCPVILTFSSAHDGYSLHSLYRKMENIDSPIILAILDTEGRAFGALLSCALRVSEHFYGSYDSFLFRCGPPLEVFKWQPGSNFYFIHSEENFLRIGAGKGNCGLWLDDNLFHGRTEHCATFESPPLVLPEDFEVAAVECWTFGPGC